jgi:hypothetical protein
MRKWDAAAVVGAFWLVALFCLPVAGQNTPAATPPKPQGKIDYSEIDKSNPEDQAKAQEPVPSITTSDGRSFKNVKVFKTVGDKVLLIHSEGTTTVSLDALTDEARKSLGLRTRAEQSSFEAEQTKKGLLKSGNDWVTPAEKQLRDYFITLNTLAPDWKTINVNPQFAAWLDGKAPDPEFAARLKFKAPDGQTWRQVAEAGNKALDAGAVANVFNTWKAYQKEMATEFVTYLSNLIPDWRDVNVNPQFLAWVFGPQIANPADYWAKFMLAEQARGADGGIAVAKIMHAWKDMVAQAEIDRLDHKIAALDRSIAAQASQPTPDQVREKAQRQYDADQRARQIRDAIQDQTRAIQDHTAAIQALQNQINAQRRIPPSDEPTDENPFPGH